MNVLLPHSPTAEAPPRGCSGQCRGSIRTVGASHPSLGAGTLAGILFDPENVFYDATHWKRWLSQLLARMGRQAPFPEFFEPWESEFRAAVDVGQRDYWDALREFLERAGLSLGMIAEVVAAGTSRKRRFESGVRCLPGVGQGLCRLAETGAALGVVANNDLRGEQVLRDLERMGLKNLFRVCVTSRDVGEAMPSPACYHRASAALGLAMTSVAVVASSPATLAGAQSCGALAIAINSLSASAAWTTVERFADLAVLVHPRAAAKRAG